MLDVLEEGPGPRPMAPDGDPAPHQIVCGKAGEQKRHPANLAYRRKIQRMTNDYQETASEVEKVKISDTLLEELGHDGLNFIWKRDGVWKEMKMDEIKLHGVRKNQRDCKNHSQN
jgi:hypothetical protein